MINKQKIRSIENYIGSLFFVACLFIGFPLQAEEENPTLDLYIESKTIDVSANCKIENSDPEEDKKRNEIGIGETVSLELKGKRVGEVTSVTWTIKGNGVSIKQQPGDIKKATLSAEKNLTADTNVTVQVTTNIDSSLNPLGPREKVFKIRIPDNIEGRHSGMRVDGYPEDGEKQIAGASSMLVLVLSPLNVSFQQIAIKEKAHQGDGHDAGTEFLRIDDRNEAWCDKIGSKLPDGYTVESPEIQNHPSLGQDQTWSCGWYTYINGEYSCHISGNDFSQIRRTDKDAIRKGGIYELKVTVSKFGRTTSRSTAGEAKHQDN